MKTTFKYLILTALCTATLASAAEMPKPREVTERDRVDVLRTLSGRFAVPKDEKLDMQAAGAFRFAGSEKYLFIERTDLGSTAFERASYGTDLTPLDEKAYAREALLPRLAKVLAKYVPTSEPPVFSAFLDEFAGAAPAQPGAPPVDPRKASVLVARTVAYTRAIDAVPVFGSELVAGLDRDGSLGRLRVHWPTIDPKLVREAQKLQYLVGSKEWAAPKDLLQGDTEILDVSAGVGHSAFADPEFRSAAVVRVLARRVTYGMEQPISSTAYHYYDVGGREIEFSAFPVEPGSDPREKGAK